MEISPFKDITSCEERKQMTASLHRLIESQDRGSVKLTKASRSDFEFYNRWGIFPWEVGR